MGWDLSSVTRAVFLVLVLLAFCPRGSSRVLPVPVLRAKDLPAHNVQLWQGLAGRAEEGLLLLRDAYASGGA